MDYLIMVAKKHSVSDYTRRVDRSKWVRLSGQLIWYRDSILKNYELDRLWLEVDDVNRLVDERLAEEANRPSNTLPAYGSEKQLKKMEEIANQQRTRTGHMPETDPFTDPEKEDDD